MTELDVYTKQLEGFRSSDEARERLVSVCNCRVSRSGISSAVLIIP
jgi:hypothetical protein